jgi:hypothetical protein
VEHVQPLDRPFPRRPVVLIAGALGLATLIALLAVAGAGLFHVRHAAAPLRHAAARTHVPKPVVPLRPRSDDSVLVLNGNGIAGAAGTAATRLLSTGYRRATAANAAQTYATSLVLFRRGWQREAGRLARDAGVRVVAPLDGRLPAADADYRLVLILGGN